MHSAGSYHFIAQGFLFVLLVVRFQDFGHPRGSLLALADYCYGLEAATALKPRRP